MKKLFLALAIIVCGLAVSAQDRTDSLHVAHYDIHLNITDFSTHRIFGYTDLQVVSKVDGLSHVNLDLQHLNVDSVFVGGIATTDYSHEGNLLHINLPAPACNNGDEVAVRVCYSGVPGTDSYFGGFYFSGEYCYNLGVAFRDLPHNFGRVWYPCLDFFTDKSTYTFHIETEAGKRAICGGYLQDSVATDSNTVIWNWILEEPVCTYLTSVAVGNYMHYADTVQGMDRVVPIDIYTRPSDFNKVPATFAHLKDVFHIYESRFGAYPWCRVGYVGVAFNGGAMEHVANIAYPNFAINGNATYESLYAHEFSHMWFGDLVTCNRAEEMWLNEGFARYNEALADEVLYPSEDPMSDGYRTNIRDLHRGVLRNAHLDDNGYWALDSMPQEVTYGTTTYDKGGLMVHTLRKYMGDSTFFAAIQNMLTTYAYQNISTMQLFDLLSQQTGTNMHDFREAWISQPGFLHFAVDSIRPTANAGEYRFFVRQRLSHARRFGNSNRIDITFFSAENQQYTLRQFAFSGEYGEGTVQLPWIPVAAVVDMDEAMGDAVIDYGFNLTAPGTKNAAFANFKLLVNAISEPTYFRVEDNLVAADSISGDNEHLLAVSTDHYWRVLCVPSGTLDGGLRFAFKAGDADAVDYNFLHGHTINEVCLVYRPDCSASWQPVAANRGGTMASGYFTVEGPILSGEYALALSDGNTGVEELQSNSDIIIYPNPTEEQLHIVIPDFQKDIDYHCRIYDSNGKSVLQKRLDFNNVLYINSLHSGIYIIAIFSEGKIIVTQKFIKK